MSIIAPPRNYITFDGMNLADFGLRCSGAGTYGSPERDVDEEEVPGRDGNLIFDNGRFKNIDIEYGVSLLGDNEEDYTRRIQALRAFLSSRRGYKRLQDTYRPEEYRLAQFSNGVDPGDEIMLRGSSFNLKFNCKPQRFLLSGELKKEYSTSGTIYNPTFFDSKPLVRVSFERPGTDTGTVVVNGTTITIVLGSLPDTLSYVDIDSEMLDSYSGASNCNDCVILTNNEFPVLSPGANNITIDGNITSVTITPRWYTV